MGKRIGLLIVILFLASFITESFFFDSNCEVPTESVLLTSNSYNPSLKWEKEICTHYVTPQFADIQGDGILDVKIHFTSWAE